MADYHSVAIKPRIFVVRQLPIAGRPLLATVAGLNVILGALPVLFILATSALVGSIPPAVVGGVGSAEWDSLVVTFVLASATFIGRQLLTPLVTFLGSTLKHRVDGRFLERLMAVSLRPIGIGALEDDDVLDSLRQASENLRTNSRSPGDAAMGTLAYLARYTELIGYLVILGVVGRWPVAVAIAASTMSFRYGHRGGPRMWTRLWPVLGSMRRRRNYFSDLGLQAPAAKEMRVFGLSGWAIDQFRRSAMEALVPLWSERRRTNTVRFVWFTVVGLLIVGTSLALLVRSAATGDLTLQQLALVLQAAIAATILGDYYHEADDRSQFGMLAAGALDDFDRKVAAHLAGDVAHTGDTGATGAADAAGLPAREICFSGVSFSYAGGRPVLDGLDLTLRVGECTAIVGLNGAGKTTLVKLLARLHEPTAGTVLVDGTDLRSFAVDSWRRQIGVIFQDFNRYELSATDNIAFGAVERPVDEATVRAAADRAGIAATLEALPRGMQTLLSRQYEQGAELSGGQWQRVAIARALYAVDSGARVLVLDEPTAALDVRAEVAFFDQFVELTRGVTTLLISHRFSSVRHADRIVVLENGRVIEDGTHESLLAAGGSYASLFHLQAERFRAGLDADADPSEVSS